VLSNLLSFIALTSIGVENLLVSEIESTGAVVSKQTIGSIRFSASTSQVQKLCLISRYATRIMMLMIESEEIADKDDLYNLAKQCNWQEYFGPSQTLAIDFNGTNNELKNTQFSTLVVKDAIVDSFYTSHKERPSISKTAPNVRIVGRLNRNKCALYIDYSGPSLSKRGYRPHQGEAPIKEHLAAALIARSGWIDNTQQPLFDPCCGSATLLIEAAMMAWNIAPGLYRKQFAFESLPGFRSVKFKELKQSLKAQQNEQKLYLIGHDIDGRVLEKAENNISQLPFAKYISLKQADSNKLTSVANQTGVVLSNLPYGERMGEQAELVNLYRHLGESFKKHFKNWQLALLASDLNLLALIKLSKKKQYKFKNGPLDCVLNLYDLNEKNTQQSQQGGLNFDGSKSFANRLKKNRQGLKSWINKEQVTCYRLYDADIPEYNVAVDVYNNYVVIYEYAPPKTVSETNSEKRLQDIIYLTAQTLDIEPSNIVVKQRKQQKGSSQYQKTHRSDQTKNSMVVEEYGVKFKVNLHDYLDTGLFLDHRLARRYIQKNCKDLRVLNLFAYTCSASTHAAIGGAKSVTSIDMSNTYLNWGKENFALNQLNSPRYHFEQADCLAWLENAKGEFDFIFLDPPTFSNSKRMKKEFDVQRDHIQLFTWVKRILAKEGTLLFSNNKRGFTMDEEGLIDLGLIATNISHTTLSPDFKRNQHIHNAWLIRSV
jgi:23S rRNA (guanine2445-N2)-methyltransferase / 23S rRNA (guanine2069-N7)-methyltransferase